MQPILVTGGAGFVAAHTCKDLAAHGFLPIAFDNLSRGHRDAVQWGPLDCRIFAINARQQRPH
jgi:UDP-arabinose 4-epimerase